MVVLIFLVILGQYFENLTRVTEDSLPLGNSTKKKKTLDLWFKAKFRAEQEEKKAESGT